MVNDEDIVKNITTDENHELNSFIKYKGYIKLDANVQCTGDSIEVNLILI